MSAHRDGAPPSVVRVGRRWSDDEVERALGLLLRAGVVIAALLVGLGALFYLRRYGGQAPVYGRFHAEPEDLRHVRGIIRAAADGRSPGFIQLGLLVLIATPVARVAASLAAFALQRDWMYVIITAIVLALLALSLSGRLV
jgi:uncharacterized membrane protein